VYDYNDQGTYIGEDGIRNKDGELEELD